MKSVMLFLVKVFANENWEIHQAVLTTLIEGEEVRQNAKSTWSIKIKESKKIPEQIKRDLLELWRKRALSDELYKAKEETESEIWR